LLATVASSCCFVLTIIARAQDPPAASAESPYNAQRKFALDLFNQNHYLEALPVLQQLANEKPDDAEVLFAYGACLVNHSATVSDEQSAIRERIQARDLLLRAKQLGNNRGLLLTLLEMLPENGVIGHEKNPDVDAAIQDGESAFARNDYDAAIAAYSKVNLLDPKNYRAVLFIGDSYFAKRDFTNAAVWYERAQQLDPNIETAFRYEADMFTRSGDMEKARNLSIKAVVANPYTNLTWRALQGWAAANHLALTFVRITSAGGVTKQDDQHINITMDGSKSTDSSAVWLAYQMSRALWQMEKFKKTFPGEPQYRHSLAEESDSLGAAASVAQGNSKKAKNPGDPDVALLLRISAAKMVEPYVLLSVPDQGIAADYAAYREQHRDQLERYLSEFVVPAAPAKK
jgi:tetratricopeptide (TPR) repeat protein